MNQLITGMIGVIAGIALIVFREKLAEETIRFQNKAFRFRFGQREIDASKLLTVPIGIFLIVLGILIALGIVDQQ